MKLKYIIGFVGLVVSLYSCNAVGSLGVEVQPQEDKIATAFDTVHLTSQDYLFPAVSAQCSDSMSMILGEYRSEKYGTLKADLVVQLAPPVNYQFPDTQYNIQPDSLVLYMFYRSYFGSANEPIEISIYELNKSTPDYYTQYLTDFNPGQFLDINNNQLLGKKVVTSVNYSLTEAQRSSSSYQPSIKYHFTDAQLQRFFSMPSSAYSSVSNFLEQFKGLYITTSYGKSTLFYLFEIDLRLFYHYSYQTKTPKGADTTITVNTYINYPASKDVRQINRLVYSDISNKINKRDTVNYITTASGVYPKVTIPVAHIREQMKSKMIGKNLNTEVFVNSATISFEATEIDSSANAIPVPTSLLMIPEAEAENFIKTGSMKLYNERKAQIVHYVAKNKNYCIDIAYLLNSIVKSNDTADTIDYLLIPIDIYTNANTGNVDECRPAKRFGAITIRSGKNQYSPMRLELGYSGF